MSTAPPTIPLGSIPQSIRSVAHYVKIANEHADRDIVVYYWCLFKAVEDAMATDSSSPEAKNFLTVAMNILEQDNEAIWLEVVAQSHIEDQAQRLFTYANSQDDSGQFNQKMMKAFYTCGYLFDSARKYSKWRATYIFGCLKRGEQPISGKLMAGKDGDDSNELNALSAEFNASANISSGPPAPKYPTDFSSHSPQPYAGGGAPQQGLQPVVGPFHQQPRDDFNTYNNLPGGQQGQQPPTKPSPAQRGQQQQFQKPPPQQTPQPGIGQNSPTPSYQPAAPDLKLEDYLEAKKYTKFASSALDYEDPKTAIDFLLKAVAVLQKKDGGGSSGGLL
ncbi:unnamed protein product [Meloidogyne enterolobii]|uniref:Uncharacterized protein n=1 Tax=Meloidogyne enterolobii TaxID=390850 RepID=A0ACB1AUF9_MELEN